MSKLNPSLRGVIAIFIAFHTLAVYFSSEPTRLGEELSFIHRIVSNQVSIKTLILEIDPCQREIQKGRQKYVVDVLVEVIESALERGCRVLELDVGVDAGALTVQYDSELQLYVIHRQNKFFELRISGGLLLQAPFVQWTSDLLSCSPIHSPTFDRIRQTPEAWRRLFSSTDLRCRGLWKLYIYCEALE